jgi:ribosomal-protein-alanine N-acetyltransferase
LKNISQKHQRADIGYRIGANYEWKWYMTEILSCFCEYVFSEKEIQRIQARIREDNSASIKLAENIWFIYEGKARNFMKKNGIFYDFLLYGLIKKEKDKKSLW